MTPELAHYYEERFTMMATTGWKQLVEDIEELKKNYELVSNVKSPDDLYFRKGQLDIIYWLLNLKEISEQSYEDLKREETI